MIMTVSSIEIANRKGFYDEEKTEFGLLESFEIPCSNICCGLVFNPIHMGGFKFREVRW